jgi:sulfur carrier protein
LQLFVNGEAREVAEGATVADLLDSIGLRPKQVAVEVNLELVPRTRHDEHLLRAGDRMEVVTLVGGG